MGKKCLKLEYAASSGFTVSWDVLLKYEFKMRKYAIDLVKDGVTYAAAVQVAINDSELRSLHFTEALKFSRRPRGRNDNNDDDEQPYEKRRGAKGAGKKQQGQDPKGVTIHPPPKAPPGGKGFGKAKTAFKGGLKIIGKTDDKRLICYKYNEGEQCDGSCNMLHICRVKGCGKPTCSMVTHPGYDASLPYSLK